MSALTPRRLDQTVRPNRVRVRSVARAMQYALTGRPARRACHPAPNRFVWTKDSDMVGTGSGRRAAASGVRTRTPRELGTAASTNGVIARLIVPPAFRSIPSSPSRSSDPASLCSGADRQGRCHADGIRRHVVVRSRCDPMAGPGGRVADGTRTDVRLSDRDRPRQPIVLRYLGRGFYATLVGTPGSRPRSGASLAAPDSRGGANSRAENMTDRIFARGAIGQDRGRRKGEMRMRPLREEPRQGEKRDRHERGHRCREELSMQGSAHGTWSPR